MCRHVAALAPSQRGQIRLTGSGIGDVARRTGVTERTLRYYEELGLLAPARDAGGRRRYDGDGLDRLSRVRQLRELGTPVADVNPKWLTYVS